MFTGVTNPTVGAIVTATSGGGTQTIPVVQSPPIASNGMPPSTPPHQIPPIEPLVLSDNPLELARLLRTVDNVLNGTEDVLPKTYTELPPATGVATQQQQPPVVPPIPQWTPPPGWIAPSGPTLGRGHNGIHYYDPTPTDRFIFVPEVDYYRLANSVANMEVQMRVSSKI